jgi:lipopolysaccharide export system permease protein
MAGRFFQPFFYGLGLFALLIFLGDMFDKMNHLVKSSASIGIILQYLWLEVPYWAVRVIPMACLLATLMAITGFVRSGEWLAVQSCGFETRDFWKPLLWCSLAVTLLSFAAQETILPACYNRARHLWRDSIHPEWEWDKYEDIALVGKPGQFIQARRFDVKEGRMDRPILEQVGAEAVETQLDAQLALWKEDRGVWMFYEGVERRFGSGHVSETPFEELASDLWVPPRNLVTRTKSADEMSLRELLQYSKRMHHLGVSPREFRVEAHAKLAYPFTNLIICALGIPVALRLRRSGKVASFAVALCLSLLYLWVIELGKALGYGGRLPPFVSAWAANIVFGAVSVWMLRRYDA